MKALQQLVPKIHGTIDRRMLINFHVRPDIAAALLPPPFRPKLVKGWAIAGICLIRLKGIRPRGLPIIHGIDSENAAHRIAVEWNDGLATREGVFIPRRDTSSRLQSLVGGTFFPGVHHTADFKVEERNDNFHLEMQSHDDDTLIKLKAHRSTKLPTSSVFTTLAEASDFFARGSVGYSATENSCCLDGLELHTFEWRVEPLAVSEVQSSFFDDQVHFPVGTIQFDCALLMRNIEHEWHVLPQIHYQDNQFEYL